MLAAFDEQGNLINLAETIPLKQRFTCPACGEAVRLRNGSVMRPHFAHVSLQNCRFYSENESAEHLSLKAELYTALSRTEQVAVEQVLPQLGQIADLLVNEKLALEVQCSRLSEDRLRERTQAYQNNGFQVLWLLGKKLWLTKRLSSLQKQLLYFSQNMGFHLWELDLDRHCLRLKYLIYEDIFGKVHYQTKTCSFAANIMNFLRLPYRRQNLLSYQVKQHQQVGLAVQKQLMAGNPRWLRRQELAYSQGRSLIVQSDADFFPQVRPPEAKDGFCQIQTSLEPFCAAFFRYYQHQENKTVQTLYPPAFYDKMRSNHIISRKEKNTGRTAES
ncbi:competence protein CoiA [Streptococcus caviae]|uniref:competence protein CoiA n=1 Tax=Streptococcus sp. 'caviae' TaxID=1915004 RepID=UPI00094B94F6|nr:competence protein CoiA family protein [Streptococcus sp. 'caviae']OLN84125.1 competence protein CoiA [Streptococcus sp. 'caviae']